MPKYAEEILAVVTELQQHPTAEQVFLEMKREHPSIALGTVYLYFFLCQQPQRACAPKAASKPIFSNYVKPLQ